MRAKISMIAMNMIAYASVRKPAHDAPGPVALKFASGRKRSQWPQGWFSARNYVGHESKPLAVGG
jgi:hypothetical protein